MIQPIKYKIALNIELSLSRGGDNGPNINRGIKTVGIKNTNPFHECIHLSSKILSAIIKNANHNIIAKQPPIFDLSDGSFPIIQEFNNKVKNSTLNACMLIIFAIFVVQSFIIGVELPQKEGIFLFPQNKDVALPCPDYNDSGSPDEGLCKGRGDIPYLLPPQIFNAMQKFSSGASALSPAVSAKQIIDFLTECDDPGNLRDHLRVLIDTYLLQPDEEMAYSKGVIYSSFLILDETLQMAERRPL